MTKEEFIKKNLEITEALISLREKEQEIQKEYINSNKIFNIGDKISTTNKRGDVEYGFVRSIHIGYNKDIEYKYVKMKKDGTPSQIQLWFFHGYTVNKVD